MIQVPGFYTDCVGNLSAIVNDRLITVTAYKGKRYLVSAVTVEDKPFSYVIDAASYVTDGELVSAIGKAVQSATDGTDKVYKFGSRAARQLYWEAHRIIPVASAYWVDEWVRKNIVNPHRFTTDEIHENLEGLLHHLDSLLMWK